MKKADVIAFFGGRIQTAKAIGITPQAVSLWDEEIPSSRIKTVEMAMHLENQKRKEAARREARRKARTAA